MIPFMETHAGEVLKYGVDLGLRTWKTFLGKLGWARGPPRQGDLPPGRGRPPRRGAARRSASRRRRTSARSSSSGNIGTVSLPLTAALAEEREFLRPGDRVGFLGIGSGLNCLMLGAGVVSDARTRSPATTSTAPGGRLHYLDEGAGDPVVMLHGNPTWSFYYRNLVLALRDSYRCVVPDHIGCGLSDKPPESRVRLLAEVAASTTSKRCSTTSGLRENLTLVLHDWGGMIGMAFAARHPERIKRIVASNTGAFPLPKSKRLPRSLWLGRNTRLGAWLILKRNAFCRAAAKWCVTRKPLPPDVRAMYLTPYDTPEHRVAVLKFVQTIPLKPTDPGYDIVSDTAASLPKFRDVPTLLLWGMKDFVFDRHFLAEWQRHFPHAEVAHLARLRALPARRRRRRGYHRGCRSSWRSTRSAAPHDHARPSTSRRTWPGWPPPSRPGRRVHYPTRGVNPAGPTAHTTLTFAELNAESDAIAHGLAAAGISRGTRTALMVPPSPDFFALTFALFKVGGGAGADRPRHGRQQPRHVPRRGRAGGVHRHREGPPRPAAPRLGAGRRSAPR